MAIIECVELTKKYGVVTALQNLTLSIEAGWSFGLLGENGAGKSTLVHMLMGFVFPTSGHLSVLGETDLARVHTRVGYVAERPYFDPHFSGYAYLLHFARLSGLRGSVAAQRIDELLERLELRDASQRSVGGYSKGMQQRLAIAQALLNDPALLILDEPTSGLDPRSQWEMRQIFQRLRAEGKTLLLCSHYLSEVESLCDQIGILRRGQLILTGSVSDLVQSQHVVEITLAEHLVAHDVVADWTLPSGSILSTQSNTLTIRAEAQAAVLSYIVQENIALLSLNPQSRSLEDVYVRATEQADLQAVPVKRQVELGGTQIMQTTTQEKAVGASIWSCWQSVLLQSYEIARFTLFSYMRSAWILLEAAFVFLVFAACFFHTPLTWNLFFGVATPTLAVLSLVSSIVLTQRVLRARLYMQLAHMSSRAVSLYGILLATSLLRVLSYLFLVLLTWGVQTFTIIFTSVFWAGSLILLLLLLFCAVLALALSRPIATRVAQLLFLCWVVLILCPTFWIPDPFKVVLTAAQLPLNPITWCYQSALQGTISGLGWLGCLLLLAYIGVLLFTACSGFAKRDLLLK